jgi:hypothetical protein
MGEKRRNNVAWIPNREMRSRFTIQASNPRTSGEYLAEDEDLNEAMQTVFPMLTEYIVIRWHYRPILISYKYDLSVCMLDVLALLEVLVAREEGVLDLSFPSDTFRSRWHVEWSHGQVSIQVDWDSVLGIDLDTIQKFPNLEIGRLEFLEHRMV